VLSITHRLRIMQNLRDVAKSLEAVEKLNKLKVKTINALHAIPSVPHRVLNDVVSAVDSDDIKEIAGQFITKAAPPHPLSRPRNSYLFSRKSPPRLWHLKRRLYPGLQ
jgi:hypothetical protein